MSEMEPRLRGILKKLKEEFAEPECALTHEDPFQLIVATVLSAQCTDERVNKVTPALFEAAPTPASLAKISSKKLEKLIQSTGFFRNKAKNLIALSKAIVEKHGGEVPKTIEELVALPGVGRKTANVVLGNAFNVPAVVVDTHVIRLSNRLALTAKKDPVKIEQDLMKILPREEWTDFAHYLILHGRKTCKALNPKCDECSVSTFCPSAHMPAGAWKKTPRGLAGRKLPL